MSKRLLKQFHLQHHIVLPSDITRHPPFLKSLLLHCGLMRYRDNFLCVCTGLLLCRPNPPFCEALLDDASPPKLTGRYLHQGETESASPLQESC